MSYTDYEKRLLAQLWPAFTDIRGTWIRMWPHPVRRGSQVFVGHRTRLPDVQAACRAAGLTLRNSKHLWGELRTPCEDELEVVAPRLPD